MHQKTHLIQKRYEGFLQTPCLWNSNTAFDIHQFEIEQKSSQLNIEIDDKLRLGKYIERFVSYQLEQEKSTEIIAENIQIQKEKITLGELDCLLLKDKKPLHLEIVYKFYLYDISVGNTEIEHCIGPNRKDSLIEKLIKLKEKQLPLLYSNDCKTYLKQYHLSSENIKQEVYFKAQLFVSYSNQNIFLKQLNNNCIAGFYINQKEINHFTNCKFYIPTKKDWLIKPHQHVNWIDFDQFKEASNLYLARQFSPLFWLKHKNGEIDKIFLVWWGNSC